MAESAGERDESLSADQDDVMSVGKLNGLIAMRIENDELLDDRKVIGEVTNLSETDSAVYFDLKDEDARIKCVLWQYRNERLAFDLEHGMEVVVRGAVDYWPEGGTISIKPSAITVVGEGDQHVALQQRRQRLAERGWFDNTHKSPLPTWPACVGLVTSLDGEARHDIQEAIDDRDPGVDLVCRHARVQGQAAPTALAEGVLEMDAHEDVEVIVVGRGGGSDDDLLAFDSEALAEAIFHAETPVVTAIGHREDETIADLVADESVITPTAVGKAVVPDVVAEYERLHAAEGALETAYERHCNDRLERLATELSGAYADCVGPQLMSLESRLERAASNHRARQRERLAQDLESAAARQRDRQLSSLGTRLKRAADQQASRELVRLEQRLEAAYESLERTHEHEQATAEAVEQATRAASGEAPRAYKVAIVALVLVVLLLVATILILFL